MKLFYMNCNFHITTITQSLLNLGSLFWTKSNRTLNGLRFFPTVNNNEGWNIHNLIINDRSKNVKQRGW